MKSKKSCCTTVGVGGNVGVRKKFNIKDFYVMGKALSGELYCLCDRSCLYVCSIVFKEYIFVHVLLPNAHIVTVKISFFYYLLEIILISP